MAQHSKLNRNKKIGPKFLRRFAILGKNGTRTITNCQGQKNRGF
jgi:hypothetical protein